MKKSFLRRDLEDTIYIEQLEGFEVKRKDHIVCKLRNSLYCLKQALRQWYKKLDSFILDHYIIIKRLGDDDFISLLLYVDNMLIERCDGAKIERLKKNLNKPFAMKDLGLIKKILRMFIWYDRGARELWVSQEKYIEKILQKFNIKDAKRLQSHLEFF